MPRIALGILGALPAPRRARLCEFSRRARARASMQGLALYFPAPASYTGEARPGAAGSRRRTHRRPGIAAPARTRLPHGAARRVQRTRLLERQNRHRAGRSDCRSDRCRHRRRGPGRGALHAGRVLRPHRRSEVANHRTAGLCRGGHRFPRRGNRFPFRAGTAREARGRSSAAFESITAAARQGALAARRVDTS